MGRVNIRGEDMPAVLDAGGDALEEAVFDGGGLVDVGECLDGETEFEFGSEDDLGGVCLAISR